MRFFWLPLILMGFSFPAFSKSFGIETRGLYERTRLGVFPDSGSSFSLNSDQGYRTALDINFNLGRRVMLNLGAELESYDYFGSAARTLTDGSGSFTGGHLGFDFITGDMTTYLKAVSRPVLTIEDTWITSHTLTHTSAMFAQLGVKLHAVSRFYDLEIEAAAGAPSGGISVDGLDVKYSYWLLGAFEMIFGRVNKSLFETITMVNETNAEFLFGVRFQLQEDKYEYEDRMYLKTTAGLGLFLRYHM